MLDHSHIYNYITKEIFMSKRCELTGISPLKGHNVSHAKNKTKRRFLPNLKKVTFRSDILKKNIKLNVTNAALATFNLISFLSVSLLNVTFFKFGKNLLFVLFFAWLTL